MQPAPNKKEKCNKGSSKGPLGEEKPDSSRMQLNQNKKKK